jgi:hypothetical protein
MSEKTQTGTVAETPKAAPAAQATAQEAPQGPDLTVQDLQALKSIIDVASSRGAFRPNEMTAVGNVYTKLETFLKAVATQSPN